MPPTTDIATDPTTPATDLLEQAFARTAARRAALAPEELMSVNLDIPSATTTVLGSLPEIRALRPAMVKQLPDFDIAQLDALEDYTLALEQTHASYLGAATPVPGLVGMYEKALGLRELLTMDAAVLAKRGLLEPSRLTELKGAIGYKNVAFELLALTNVFKDHWSKITSRTAVTASEIEEARTLAQQIINAVGAREQAPSVVAGTADARARAYTLFMRAYEEVRSAVAYLRRKEHDAESIAPSLYAGRTKRKTDAGDTHAEPAAPTAPKAAPATAFGAPGTPDANPFTTS